VQTPVALLHTLLALALDQDGGVTRHERDAGQGQSSGAFIAAVLVAFRQQAAR